MSKPQRRILQVNIIVLEEAVLAVKEHCLFGVWVEPEPIEKSK